MSKDCPEVCCNKCSQLLSQTAAALDMFERSDAFWRVRVLNPMVRLKNEYLECTADEQPYDQLTEYLNDNIKMADSEPEFINTEFLDDVRSGFGEFAVKQSDNVHKEFAEVLKVAEEDENVDKKRITKSSEAANDKPFQCSQCDEVCRTRLLLTRHMINIHSLRLCVRCNFTAPDRFDYQ